MSATTDHPRAGSPGPDDGDESLFEDLVEELTDRLQAGDPVDVEDFLARDPAQAERLRRLIPSLELMDDLGQWSVREGNRVGPPPTDPAAGLGELGDFRLIREVGRGGMGIVYEAEQVSLGRRVALKLLPMAAAMDPRQIQRFRVEAQAAACLHHPHIVPVHGVGCERGVHYYAMQLIDGRSLAAMVGELRRLDGLDPGDAPGADLAAIATSDLAARLLTGGAAGSPGRAGSDSPTVALPANDSVPANPTPEAPPAARTASSGSSTRNRQYVRNVARLALEAAEALDHAHTRGILHRDIKPANLLLDAEGRLWVTDFGLAQVRGDDRLTLTGDLLGTLRYMSPEQALGRRVVVDGRTDVYSLGVTLYELLTLHPAVDGRDRAEILRRIADGEPTPLRKVNPSVPADLETIVLKATAKDVASRYATAQELADDLRNFLEDRPIRARRPSLADRARRWGRRHRTLAWSAAMTVLVAALMLAGGIGYVARDRAARLAQTGQRVAVALAGARTAIEAGDLTLAGQRVAEAQGRLGPERERLPDVATDIDLIRHEIEARQADATRFSQLLKRASDAQDRMSGGRDVGAQREAEEALRLYGVLTEKDWTSRLENCYLTADQKQQVRETAYITLVSLADFGVRWSFVPGHDPRAFERSLDLLQRAQAFHQPTRAFYFVRAECRRRQGNTAAAAEDEKQFKAAPARTAWDYYLPGHTAGWGGDLDEAIRSYQAALRLQPDHFNSLFFLALRLSTDKINRLPEAIAYYTGCIALRPDHYTSHRNRAGCYLELGQRDVALADCRQLVRLYPGAAEAHITLADMLEQLGKPDEAIAAYGEAARVEPGNAVAHNNLGCLLRDNGHLDEAIISLNEALRLRPDQGCFYNNLGVALCRKGELDRAVAACKEAVRLGPADHTDHHLSLAGALAAKGDVAEAIAINHKAIAGKNEEHPDTLRGMHHLAMLYKGQGELTKAQPLLVRTLEIGRRVHGETHPDMLTATINLASLYQDQGELAKAEELFNKVLRQPGLLSVDQLTSISDTLGCETYERAGRFAKAESLYREALKTIRQRHEEASSNSTYLQVLLARNLLMQQRYAEAEPLLRECLKFREQKEPDVWTTFNTKSLLGDSLLGQKRYSDAESMLLAGYEGMRRREGAIPPIIRKSRLTEAVERLVHLYEAWGRPEKAAAWRTELGLTDLPADVFARP